MTSPIHSEIARRALSSGNCLCVLASGLGESSAVSAILSQFLARNPNIAPLVIVLNAEDSPNTITGEILSDQREKIYSAGGIVSVTARVLLSDLLCHRLDAALINLIILTRAHEASDVSNEAFLVRVFRERNGTGFFIALTEKPHAVSLEQIVKSFFISDLVLVPRFHEICLKTITEDLTIAQHDCAFAVRQMEMQSLLESLVGSSINEIKKSVKLPSVLDDLNAKSIISNKSELFNLRKRLEPVWLRLSWTARQIVSDLGIIRKLLVGLTRYDAVHFLAILLAQQQLSGKSSPWWFSEDAQRLVRVARERVGSLDSDIEVPTVWSMIERIAKDDSNQVEEPETKKPRTINSRRILIVAPDDLSGKQIQGFVSEGAQRCLLESLERQRTHISFPIGFVQSAIDSTPSISLEAIVMETNSRNEIQVVSILEHSDDLMDILHSFKPDTVILVEPSLVAVRCMEVYKLVSQAEKIQLHVIHHSQSLVEPKFSTLIDREAKAFDDMIKLKSGLMFVNKNELYEQKKREEQIVAQRASTSSRQGGSMRRRTVRDMIKQTILIDAREFRSVLPFLLFKKKFDVVPATLAIGDYILSRDIAVERKSVTGSDLQQSLLSGRLYKQLVNMTHAFPWPILLLEFTTGKTFQLQSTDAVTGEINPGSLIAQIIAILIHFPTVRLIWSPAFQFTANVFARLKQGREQPRIDPGTREPVPGNDPSAGPRSVTSKRAIEFLKACPGITAANLPNVLKRVKSVRDLVQLNQEELSGLLGKRDGASFHRFISHMF